MQPQVYGTTIDGKPALKVKYPTGTVTMTIEHFLMVQEERRKVLKEFFSECE